MRRRRNRRGIERAHRLAEVPRGEVLILCGHAGVAVAEDLHHRALAHALRREDGGDVVPQIVEAKIRDAEILHKAGDITGETRTPAAPGADATAKTSTSGTGKVADRRERAGPSQGREGPGTAAPPVRAGHRSPNALAVV